MAKEKRYIGAKNNVFRVVNPRNSDFLGEMMLRAL